jgi:hypothetical protein
MSFEPPNGISNFVNVLRRADHDDAIGLLRLAFDNAAAEAISDDFRLRCAAPALLEACKLALPVFEAHGLDTAALMAAVEKVERIGLGRPVLVRGGKDLPVA